MKCTKKILSSILCMVLIVAMALFTTGCGDKSGGSKPDGNTPSSESGVEASVPSEDNTQADVQQLGEGNTRFRFTVVDKEGSETQFEIHTDKETVGDALLELGLIAGDESEYGLYVKTVNGITADYDKDGVYWAFYVNDEYASSGVSSTTITEGESYSFRIE